MIDTVYLIAGIIQILNLILEKCNKEECKMKVREVTMKKKRLFKGILCSAVLAGCLMIAKPLTGHAEEMPETDTSKGVTMETENNTDYLYLNGNSVVIKEADASTEDNPLINLYIDANRNGIVDADETMVSVDNIRDFQPCRIYGVKAEKLTAPFRITVEIGTVGAIYGVYGSEAALQVSNEAAVTIDMKGGTVSYIAGVCNAAVSSASDTAVRYVQSGGTIEEVQLIQGADVTAQGGKDGVVDADMSGGTIKNLYVLSNASVKGKEASQALNISATGSSQITALYVARANVLAEDAAYQIIGDVSVNLDYEKQAANYNITALYGLIQDNTEIKGNVSYCFNNANINQLGNLLSKITNLSGHSIWNLRNQRLQAQVRL